MTAKSMKPFELLCPLKDPKTGKGLCYGAHTLDQPHIWVTLKCRSCDKLVGAQTPHPNPRGGMADHWLTVCEDCDVYSNYPMETQ